MTDPTLVEQASALLKEINLLYGLASGALLKYSFDNTKDMTTFDRSKVVLAGASGFGSLVLSLVIVALMWNIAVESIGDGTVKGTLVIFVTTFVVMIGLVVISLWAIWRVVKILHEFKGHWSD